MSRSGKISHKVGKLFFAIFGGIPEYDMKQSVICNIDCLLLIVYFTGWVHMR